MNKLTKVLAMAAAIVIGAWAGTAVAQTAVGTAQSQAVTGGQNLVNVDLPNNALRVSGTLVTKGVSGTNPTNGWALGGVQTGTVALVTGTSVLVEISGTTYRLGIVQ